jgi:hypothetical protein
MLSRDRAIVDGFLIDDRIYWTLQRLIALHNSQSHTQSSVISLLKSPLALA